MENNPSSSRTDRKFIERNRRNQMRTLCSQLNSLVPHQSSREVTSVPDQLDDAINYIKKLQIDLERMKDKKDSLMGIQDENKNRENVLGLKPPQIELHRTGSALRVVLTTGLDCQFMFNEVIRVLQEDGADIVNASYTVVQDTVFHTIHSQVEQYSDGAARIPERLKKLIYGYGAF